MVTATDNDDDIIERGFDLPIVKAAPTQVTVETMREQLRRVGLTCQTDRELEEHIHEVRSQFNDGSAESFFIGKPVSPTVLFQADAASGFHFMHAVSAVGSADLDRMAAVAADHGGGPAFISGLVAANPGGAEMISQLANIGVEVEDPKFATAFAHSNPVGMAFLTATVKSGLLPLGVGNWKPGDSTMLGTLSDKLAVIQNIDNFSWLKQHRVGFTGNSVDQTYKGRKDNVQAVKSQFVTTATDVASTLVEGISKVDAEAMFSNAIAQLKDENASNYEREDSRILFLAKDPKELPDGRIRVKGVGVIGVNWNLKITDYKKKKKGLKHDTTLDVHARGVLYPKVSAVTPDYEAAPKKNTTF